MFMFGKKMIYGPSPYMKPHHLVEFVHSAYQSGISIGQMQDWFNKFDRGNGNTCIGSRLLKLVSEKGKSIFGCVSTMEGKRGIYTIGSGYAH